MSNVTHGFLFQRGREIIKLVPRTIDTFSVTFLFFIIKAFFNKDIKICISLVREKKARSDWSEDERLGGSLRKERNLIK